MQGLPFAGVELGGTKCVCTLAHSPEEIAKQETVSTTSPQETLGALDRALARDGRLIVSVPIEIGPTLAVKQAVRAFAAAVGLHEYAGRERYRPGEFARMIFADSATRVDRPATSVRDEDGTLMRFHGHKGFNWRALERLIATSFVIERRLYSPIPLAGPWINSQVWFVCRTRSS